MKNATRFFLKISVIFWMRLVFGLVVFGPAKSGAQTIQKDDPVFLYTKSSDVNLRLGPATTYPIAYTYRKRHLPFQEIVHFELWVKVRDFLGQSGWIHSSLLTDDGIYALVRFPQTRLYKEDPPQGPPIAFFDKNVLVEVESCSLHNCLVSLQTGPHHYKGFVTKKSLWGVKGGAQPPDPSDSPPP